MRVLVPVEDSLFGSAIALFISRHQWPENTEFRVVNMVEPLPCSMNRSAGHDLLKYAAVEIIDRASKLVDEVASKIKLSLPGSSVTPQVIEGYPQDELLEIAENWQADLIVAGSHGRKGFNQFFMGSTSLRLAAEATCPILLIRPDARTLKLWNAIDPDSSAQDVIEQSLKDIYKEQRARKILVAVDGSEVSNEIINFIKKHSWDEPCHFKVLRVYQTPGYLRFLPGSDLEEVNKDALDDERASLRKYAVKLRTFFHSPRVEEELVEGDPKTMIVRTARDWDADLIIVGSHAEHARRPLLGSVSLSVLSSAPCAVLVLRQSLTQKEKNHSTQSLVDVTMI